MTQLLSHATPHVMPIGGCTGAARCAHLIGISGSGMLSLAEYLRAVGWRVTGSDLDPAPAARRLGRRVHVEIDNAAARVPPGTELVVYSAAVPEDHRARQHARTSRITQISYPRMLRHLTDGRHGVAVAGTHGKSTVASMAAEILSAAGFDPGVLVGAQPAGRGVGSRPGTGELFVVEACEYRRHFLQLQPRSAAVLGIDADHFDCYPTATDLHDAFGEFVDLVPADGLLLANADCAATMSVVGSAACRVTTFGAAPDADWRLTRMASRRGYYGARIACRGRAVVEFALRVPGRHNAQNALAAAAMTAELGAPPAAIAHGLARFRGLERRLEHLGQARGVVLLDDYAHHPTEIAATLRAAAEIYPGRRRWCVFQPHQVSRTAMLLDELAASLQNADRVVITPIYRAREGRPKPGEVSASDLAQRTAALGAAAESVDSATAAVARLAAELASGDVCLLIGAGDIRNIAHELAQRIRGHRAAA